MVSREVYIGHTQAKTVSVLRVTGSLMKEQAAYLKASLVLLHLLHLHQHPVL
jgi:hypothetical protein